MNLIKLQRSLDRTGGNVLSNVLLPFKSRKRNENPQKILIINLWGMGDAVLTLPLIAEVKKRFPSSQLDVLATKRVDKVYTLHQKINNVLLLEDLKTFKKRRKYDLVIDTEHYLNSSALAAFILGKETIGYGHGQRAKLYSHKVDYNDKQHVVHNYLDLLRKKFPEVEDPRELVKLDYSEEDKEKVADIFKENNISENNFVVGFCVNSAESALSRRWAKEKFAKVADTLVGKYNAKTIFVGSPGEIELNQEVINLMQNKENALNAGGKTSVNQSFALIEQCDLFISNDTGPMHVGAAQQVPTVGLFGPNTPVRYGPYGSKNTAVYKPVCEEPCINVHKGSVPDCKEHNHMSKIEVEDVMEAVEELIEKNQLLSAK